MTASSEARETALIAAQAAADKLATDVSIIDVSDRLAITDAFVLASAPNERQVQSIVDGVEEQLRTHGMKPVRREGVAEGRWVLLDFVDIVVHVQHAEERAYYALERLWKDCPVIPFTDKAAPAGSTGSPTVDGGAAPGRNPFQEVDDEFADEPADETADADVPAGADEPADADAGTDSTEPGQTGR